MVLEKGEDGDREVYNSLYRSLQHPERRRILFGLLEHNPQDEITVPEDVHFREQETEELTIELHHNHLPVLEDAGLIQWDREGNQLHKGPKFGIVRELLEAIRGRDPIAMDE